MIGRITYIISTAGFRAMDGVISDERRRLDNIIAPAAYVSYDPRMMSVVGWHGYRIAFKGGTRNMILYALELLRKNYAVSERYDNYEDGNYVVGVLLRDRARAYAFRTGTPEPEPDPTWLYFTMPNGGVVTLTRNGNPTPVTLEYSLDNGASWTEWIESGNERMVTLAAGQTMHVRNMSETSTRFSTGGNDYYNFAFTTDTYVGGNTNSLLCKIPTNATITNYCYYHLFLNCTSLTMSDTFTLPSSTLTPACYSRLFRGCTNLTISDSFILPATTVENGSYAYIFRDCTNVNLIRTSMTDISATSCIEYWLLNVSPTGDFYCPAELTIPTGSSGIPSGWTRHDLPTT